MPDRPTCKDCRFWDERGDYPGVGYCRRKSPEWAIGLEVERAWPETDGKKDWCGDHEVRSNQKITIGGSYGDYLETKGRVL